MPLKFEIYIKCTKLLLFLQIYQIVNLIFLPDVRFAALDISD